MGITSIGVCMTVAIVVAGCMSTLSCASSNIDELRAAYVAQKEAHTQLMAAIHPIAHVEQTVEQSTELFRQHVQIVEEIIQEKLDPNWTPVCYYQSNLKCPWKEVLYERTYPSGRKAWRYYKNGCWIYPPKYDVQRRMYTPWASQT